MGTVAPEFGLVFVPGSVQGLNALGKDLKRTIQISFVSQEGLLEAGIDGGGLFKEFVNTLSGQAISPLGTDCGNTGTRRSTRTTGCSARRRTNSSSRTPTSPAPYFLPMSSSQTGTCFAMSSTQMMRCDM
eukprot:2019906-Rhodomonas_salina.1